MINPSPSIVCLRSEKPISPRLLLGAPVTPIIINCSSKKLQTEALSLKPRKQNNELMLLIRDMKWRLFNKYNEQAFYVRWRGGNMAPDLSSRCSMLVINSDTLKTAHTHTQRRFSSSHWVINNWSTRDCVEFEIVAGRCNWLSVRSAGSLGSGWAVSPSPEQPPAPDTRIMFPFPVLPEKSARYRNCNSNSNFKLQQYCHSLLSCCSFHFIHFAPLCNCNVNLNWQFSKSTRFYMSLINCPNSRSKTSKSPILVI